MRALLLFLTILMVSGSTIAFLGEDHLSTASSMPMGARTMQSLQQAPVHRNFTLYVGITGFNSTYQAGITLIVNQGDLVSITFVYNDTAWNNPHNILITAYNLYSGTLDPVTPVRSIGFTANIPGPTSFVCIDSNCAGHANLQAGVLDVKPYAGAEWIKTTVHLSGGVQARSRPVIILSAHIIDVNGSVVPGVLLRFYRNSTWGFAEIGVATTNSSGSASLAYSPPATGNIVFKAIFMGTGPYLPSNSDPVTIYYVSPQDSGTGFPYVWGQNPIIDFRIVGAPVLTGLFWIGVVFAVVGSVWATYLFVLRQVVEIWREGRGEYSRSRSQEPSTSGTSLAQMPVRQLSYPASLLVGLGMMLLGYADFLLVSMVVPGVALVMLPVIGLAEAIGVSLFLQARKK